MNILLKNLEKRCAEQMGIQLKITDSVRDYLAESGFDSKYGARPLRRAIQNKLEDPMANEILEGRIRTGDTVKVQLHQKKICLFRSEIRNKRRRDYGNLKSKKNVKSWLGYWSKKVLNVIIM